MPNALSHIASQHLVDGFVRAQEDLFVDGHVRGRLESSGKVTVGRGGILEADVQLETLVVQGIVVGTVQASGDVIIEATGQLKGAIRAARLTVQPGGRIAAQVETGSSVQTKPAEARQTRENSAQRTRKSHGHRKKKRALKVEDTLAAAADNVSTDSASADEAPKAKTNPPKDHLDLVASDQLETVEMADEVVEDTVAPPPPCGEDSAAEIVELSVPNQEGDMGETVQPTVPQPPSS